MDQRMLELQYRVEHEHPDGSWGQMVEEERPPHLRSQRVGGEVSVELAMIDGDGALAGTEENAGG